MHGPSAAQCGPMVKRAGRSSRGGHTSRPAPRGGRVVTRTSRKGDGSPPPSRDAVAEAPNGRLVVSFVLVGRLDWNKG